MTIPDREAREAALIEALRFYRERAWRYCEADEEWVLTNEGETDKGAVATKALEAWKATPSTAPSQPSDREVVEASKTEDLRQEIIAQNAEYYDKPLNEGHEVEALDRSHCAENFLAEKILEHPYVVKHPDLFAAAEKAHQAVLDLYQAIGRKSFDEADALSKHLVQRG